MGTKLTLVVMLAVAACGGHKAQPTDPSSSGGGDDSGGGQTANPCGDNGMCPPEMLDRIKETLDSKRLTVSRCLSDAVIAGNADKNARGQVTVDFVITPAGKATNVKVGSSTVKSKAVDECVVGKVEAMAFPEVPKNLDWSYTYAFESN